MSTALPPPPMLPSRHRADTPRTATAPKRWYNVAVLQLSSFPLLVNVALRAWAPIDPKKTPVLPSNAASVRSWSDPLLPLLLMAEKFSNKNKNSNAPKRANEDDVQLVVVVVVASLLAVMDEFMKSFLDAFGKK